MYRSMSRSTRWLAAWTATLYPQAAAVRVSAAAYHHAGATSTQDLAFAMATAVEYLRATSGAGLDVNTAARQIVFGVSVGCQFFQAIAKLRALRNRGSTGTNESLAEYFAAWRSQCPEDLRPFVNRLAAVFAVKL